MTGILSSQLVGSFTINNASKISGLRILLVSGGGGGGVGWGQYRGASGGGGGNVRSLPCKNYVNNTTLNITIGLGGAGATVVNTTTPTGTVATRGGNSAFNVTSGSITYTISSIDYIGAAPHTYTLANNGYASSENNATTTINLNPVTFQQGAGAGGGGGGTQSLGQKGSGITYYGGSGGDSGAQGGNAQGWEFGGSGPTIDTTINGYSSSASGGGGGPGGTTPSLNGTTIRYAGNYFYNASASTGGNGTSITNAEFNNETITYGGGGGWAMPSGMNIDTGWSFLSVTRVNGGAGGGGGGVYNGTVANGNYTSPNPSPQNGWGGFGGGGGGVTVNWSNGNNTGNSAQGGLGGNGVVEIIFTLL
jgi:hypothetical protein